MNRRSPRRPLVSKISAASLALVGLLGLPAQAQTTRTWQNPGGGGDWGTPANWSGSAVPTSLDTAQIGGLTTSNTNPDLNAATFSVAGLSLIPRTSGFSGSSFSILSTGGQGTLNLGSGGIVVRNGALATIASSVTLNLTSNQNWGGGSDSPNVGTGLTVAGLVTGSAKITLTDANSDNTGVFTFSNGGSTFSGGFQINKRTAAIGASSTVSAGDLVSGPLGTGTVTLNGGTFRSDGGTARTLHNNVLVSGTTNLGSASGTGALTFSDAGLTTASTFTLGSSTNGNVSVLRVGGTNVTLDQVIAESGGSGQSVNFAATSGTPTVTINRTKTATGNILSGGVGLVLANGAANPGSILAVNGSVTATAANKFSSGALVSDGANLVATDATNYSAVAGGTASVYNNGRVSFATTQTEAAIDALVSADSRFRLGLGSGSGSATYTENYSQAALGDGRTGLVSASTGTSTYTGVLGAGSDATYRVGGGAGTLSLTAANTLTGSNSVIVEGGGTLSVGNAQNYTGTTTVNSNLTLSGPTATINGSSGVIINNSTLSVDNTGGAAGTTNRFADAATVTLNRGVLSMVNNGTGTPPIEVFDTLAVNAGANAVNVGNTPTGTKGFSVTSLTRANNALVTFRGDSFGSNGGSLTNRNIFRITGTAPTLTGGGGADGTTTISILPWARGNTTGSASFAATTFVTFDAANQVIRPLNTTTEFVQANNNTTARIDQAIATAGGATNYNVRSAPGTTGGATLVNTASSSVTLNSLLFDNVSATGANTYGFNSSTINVTSGAVHIQNSVGFNLTLNSGTLAFGSAEGVITNNANSFYLTTLSTQITGTGGVSIYNVNSGGIALSSVSTAGFSGGLTIGGNGFVAVDQDQRFGAATNNITHGGGELRFFAGFTSTRGLNLLGNVGDNTLGNNNTSGQVVSWNGNISGDGRLRLINNNGANGTNGFNIGGNNTYTGGTQIEGIAVTASSNTALGTGTVTLQGANGNVASLSVTAAAPVIGGLRGTDGTVTINPTGSSATLTVGSNNENTVFNGVIAQGAGKTGSLDKVGTGKLVLGGNNTFTGETKVSAGTLDIQGTIASDLSIAGGKLELGGAGIKNLTLAANKNFSLTSGTWSFTFEGPSSFDSIIGSGTGTFTISGGTIDFGGVDLVAGSYQILGGFASGTVAGLGFAGYDTDLFSVALDNAGLLNITAVPEPSTWALGIGAGLFALVVGRRIRRRQSGV